MGLDDFAPAEEANDLDEDLFDFPPMELPEAPVAEAEPAPAGEAAAAPAAADAAAPAAAAPVPNTPTICTGLDPELDEDLFGFPPMDLSELGIVAGDAAQGDIEESIQKATQQVTDMLEDDLGDIVREASAEEATPAPPPPPLEIPDAPAPAVQEAAPAPQPAAQPAPAAQAPAPAAPVATQVAYAAPVAVSSTSPRAMWVLTAGVLLFMVGILSIAWRATSVFHEQIQSVRKDVADSATNLRDSTTDTMKELAELERELIRYQVNAAKTGQDSEIPPQGLEIQAPHEVVLQVATEAIENGQYQEARQMLFNLLAEADNHPEDIRDDMERRASTLIAESHKSQAESMPGESE